MKTPEWLAKRGGLLQKGADGKHYLVVLNNEPQYRLTPGPMMGKFGCLIVETNSGKYLNGPTMWPSFEGAVAGGLEQLREKLGW